MERKWTAAQRAAMNTKDKTLLVSAAAGSGKTAVLTERIIRSLTDSAPPKDIEKTLVVTFTRAAAEELKSRIFAALSEAIARDPSNRYLTEQLIKLGSARICTIDSFYLDLIRSHFSLLGISAAFRIADTAEMDVLEKRTMEQVMDHFYETDDTFPAFAECFTGTRSADKLSDIFITLAHRSASIPEGIGFFLTQAAESERDALSETDFFSTTLGEVIRNQVTEAVTHCYHVICEACLYVEQSPEQSAALLPAFAYDKDFCLHLLDTLKDPVQAYALTKELLDLYEPLRRKPLKAEFKTAESERFTELRTELVDTLRALRKKYFSKSPETIRRAMRDTARYTRKLYDVLSYYDDALTAEKQQRAMMDFQDIRRYTLKLLVQPDGTPTQVAREVAEQFTDIYIDEYQDVDLVQDLIFRSISQPRNRFMVGDIKQSIYSFRGAEPQVFANYRALFPSLEQSEGQDCATIFMSNNFRCDESIIDFTNLVCSRIFAACPDSIGYKEEDDLVFTKPLPTEDYVSPSVEVSVVIAPKKEKSLSADSEDAPEKKELEAEHIANLITSLLRGERKADGSLIRPGDIAVLFRSNSMGSYVAEALRKRGIASSQNVGDSYFESPDVLMVLCLLNTVDNPHRDIYLTGTLRSPLYGFSLEDLIHVRVSADSSQSLYDALLQYAEGTDELALRCAYFRDSLEELRQSAASLPIDRFLRILFESEIFLSSGLFREGNGEGANLMHLYEYARSFESGSFRGLYNFIEMIGSLIEDGKKMTLPSGGASSDRVNLMSIHQSKGLEFPVCILSGSAGRFNRQDQQVSLLFDYPTGVAMKISDTTGFARINTPMREAVMSAIERKQTEEEMRILYVALTRARERLYVTASTTREEDKLMDKAISSADFCDRYTLLRATSYLDWLLLPFAKGSLPCARLTFVIPKENEIDTLESAEDATEEAPYPMDEQLYRILREKFSFTYPYAHMKRIPAKLSVSRLSPDVLDTADTARELFPEEKRVQIPDFFLSDQPSRVSAAERGTATHHFLQFCDFRRLAENGTREEIGRLVSQRFLPQQMASLIYEEELDRFLQSDLFPILMDAKQIIREQRFNLLLSPDSFTEDRDFRQKLCGERLAVQGVIDLLVVDRDGRLLLVDYKTDRLTKDELSNPLLAEKKMNQVHGLQLSYYTHATTMLFDRAPDRVAIYSTHAGRTFDIEPMELIFSENVIDNL